MSNELIISWTSGAQIGGIDLHPYTPIFRVTRNNSVIGTVNVRVNGFAAAVAMAGRLEDQARRDVFDTALTRYALRRLEAALREGEDVFSEQTSVTWDLANEELEGMLPAIEEKVCHYQRRQERDLFCTAASAEDRTAVGTLSAVDPRTWRMPRHGARLLAARRRDLAHFDGLAIALGTPRRAGLP